MLEAALLPAISNGHGIINKGRLSLKILDDPIGLWIIFKAVGQGVGQLERTLNHFKGFIFGCCSDLAKEGIKYEIN